VLIRVSRGKKIISRLLEIPQKFRLEQNYEKFTGVF